MAAPKGNQFWKLSPNPGNNKIFSTPEEIWEQASKYFEWCDAHPWMKSEQLKKPYQNEDTGEWITLAQIPTARPYTIGGLCLFLGITEVTFENYASREGYEAFFSICSRIKAVIYNQKFEGAAVGAFNPSIIARDLGLADKREHSGEVSAKAPQVIVYNSAPPLASSEDEIEIK